MVLGFTLAGDHGLPAMRKARRDLRSLTDAVAVLRVENQRLRQEAAALRDDPATIEIVARRELGLIKPGELLVLERR